MDVEVEVVDILAVDFHGEVKFRIPSTRESSHTQSSLLINLCTEKNGFREGRTQWHLLRSTLENRTDRGDSLENL